MQKRFRLQPISALLFIVILILSGCSQESSSRLPANQSTITLRISQGNYWEIVPEDRTFSNLLNNPTTLDEKNAPAPDAWHKINYDHGRAMSIQVNNCAELDLLELVIYNKLDFQGRPKSYQYVAVCGPESGKHCGTLSTVSTEAQRKLRDPRIKNFAFSGICISGDTLDARSFITFIEK